MSEAPKEDKESFFADLWAKLFGWSMLVLVFLGPPSWFLYYGLTADNACERTLGLVFASPWFLVAFVWWVLSCRDRRRGWTTRQERWDACTTYLELVDGEWCGFRYQSDSPDVSSDGEWPSDEEWDDATPAWAHGRREIILKRMNAASGVGVRIAEDVGTCPQCGMIQIVRKWYPKLHDEVHRDVPATKKQRCCEGCSHRWLSDC